MPARNDYHRHDVGGDYGDIQKRQQLYATILVCCGDCYIGRAVMAMADLVSGTLMTMMTMLMAVMLLFRFRATYLSTRQTTPASLSFSDTMASVSGLARPSVKSDGFGALSYN